MVEHYFEILVVFTINILEFIGVFVIAFSCLRGFFYYILNRLKFNDTVIKIEIAKGLALGLEFKLGAEILRTVLVRTLEEIKVLAEIIALRIILTYVIHWEIKSELKHDDRFQKKAENEVKPGQ